MLNRITRYYSEGEDCGEGIHLIAVDNSTIARNEVEYNAGGILITDETGPLVPVTDTVVSQNSINQESVDFVFNVPSGNVELHLNDFNDAGIGVDNLGAGTVNATQNWWNCTAGPNTFGCGTTVGPNVKSAPALSRPF